MTTETTITKRIKQLEERLDHIEDTNREQQKKISELSRQIKRTKGLVHRNHQETLINTDQIGRINQVLFHFSRKNFINEGSIHYLLKENKKDTDKREK